MPIKTPSPAMTPAGFTKLFERMREYQNPEAIAKGLGVARVSLYRWARGARRIDGHTAEAVRRYYKRLLKKNQQ